MVQAKDEFYPRTVFELPLKKRTTKTPGCPNFAGLLLDRTFEVSREQMEKVHGANAFTTQNIGCEN
jgi:hypothetical protein